MGSVNRPGPGNAYVFHLVPVLVGAGVLLITKWVGAGRDPVLEGAFFKTNWR